MFKSFIEKIVGSYSEREIKRINPIVDRDRRAWSLGSNH